MAEMTMQIQLKIQDLDSFERLVSALGAWAEEVQERGSLTPAEAELFDAAVELEDTAKG